MNRQKDEKPISGLPASTEQSARQPDKDNNRDPVSGIIPCDVAVYHVNDGQYTKVHHEPCFDPLSFPGGAKLLDRIQKGEREFILSAYRDERSFELLYTSNDETTRLSVHYEYLSEADGCKVIRLIHDITRVFTPSYQHEFLADILQQIAQGVVILDIDLEITYANVRAVTLLSGKSVTSISGNIVNYISPENGWSDVQSWLIDKLGTPFTTNIPFTFETKSGRRLLRVSCFLQLSLHGRSVVLLISDVTSETNRMNELSRAKQVIDTVNDSVVHVDTKLNIIDYNAGASTTLGLWSGTLGSSILEHMTIRTKDGKSLPELCEIVETQDLWHGDGIVIIPDVFRINVFLRITCNRDEYFEPKGFTFFVTDIDRTIKNSDLLAALSELTRIVSEKELHIDNLSEILSDAVLLFGLEDAVSLVKSPYSEGTTIYPKDKRVYENLSTIEMYDRIIKDRFAGQDSVIFGNDAKKLYNFMFSRSESNSTPPSWIANIEKSGKSYGLLLIWDNPNTNNRVYLDKLAVRTITSHISSFVEQSLSYGSVQRHEKVQSDIINRTTSLIVKFSRLGRIIFKNAAFSELFPDSKTSNVLLDGVLAPASELVSKGTWERIVRGKTETMQTEIQLPNGRKRLISWTISPLQLEWTGDKPERFIASGEDVTDIMEIMEISLEAGSMKEIRSIVGKVSHFFNNSLTVIFAVVLELQRKYGRTLDKHIVSRISMINDQAMKINALVKELLSYSGQSLSIRSEFVFDDAAREAVEHLKVEFPQVIFVQKLNCHRRKISAVSDYITTIFTELLRNAAEAARESESPRVVLETAFKERPAGDSLTSYPATTFVIKIEDNGKGIPYMMRDILYDVFSSSKTPRSSVPRGLGLPKVRSLAHLMNGNVELSSAPSGTIATAYLESAEKRDTAIISHNLPSQVQSSAPDAIIAVDVTPPEKPAVADTSPLFEYEFQEDALPVIVALDDDTTVLDILGHFLRELGASVVCFSEEGKAYEFIRMNSDRVSAMIVDYNLEDTTGPEFIEKLRAMGFNRPVFLCTGFGEDIADDARLDGVISVITKPFSIEDLERHLRMFLPSRIDDEDSLV